jgi:hypothetical protein
MRYLLVVLFAGGLADWQTDRNADPPPVRSSAPDSALVVDMHTSCNSLDWPGVYEGLRIGGNGVTIHTQLTLAPDGSFTMVTRRLVGGAALFSGRGQFDWELNGNILVLHTDEGEQRYAVGEGRLLLLEAGLTQPAWDRSEILLVQSSGTQPYLGDRREGHRSRLVHATDPPNRRIDDRIALQVRE